VENNNVIYLNIPTDELNDISPVGALKGLRKLTCTGTAPGKGKLADLSPLKGLPLTMLNCEANPVADLTPLSGMPLFRLSLNNTNVADLAPLREVPLVELECSGTKVTDYSPLKGLPLKSLTCSFKLGRDAEVLRGIKTLETLNRQPAANLLR